MKFLGVLRVSKEVEIAGMDRIKHGEPAYPLGSYEEPGNPHNSDLHLPGIYKRSLMVSKNVIPDLRFSTGLKLISK